MNADSDRAASQLPPETQIVPVDKPQAADVSRFAVGCSDDAIADARARDCIRQRFGTQILIAVVDEKHIWRYTQRRHSASSRGAVTPDGAQPRIGAAITHESR